MTHPKEMAKQVLDRIGWTPGKRGPVPLRMAFDEYRVNHVTLPNLSLATIAQHLLQEGYVQNMASVEDMLEDSKPLFGLCFRMGTSALAFIHENDILPRRRFTAAHELGHALMHQLHMERYLPDDQDTLQDHEDPTIGIEKEANQFAAELLMPEQLIHARAEAMQSEYHICPRLVLGYQLSSELLVSRKAIRYRLLSLGVGHD